jgi:hypothetical protein
LQKRVIAADFIDFGIKRRRYGVFLALGASRCQKVGDGWLCAFSGLLPCRRLGLNFYSCLSGELFFCIFAFLLSRRHFFKSVSPLGRDTFFYEWRCHSPFGPASPFNRACPIVRCQKKVSKEKATRFRSKAR